MPATYTPPTYPYRAPPELSGELRVPVAIVGAGPVGLACALEMALAGVRAVVLDDNDTVSTGSRAICYAKRTLEILDRYGCGEPVVERGIGWRVGKVFHGERLAYQFDLLPESGHRRPAFVNLQQYHLEETMLARLLALGGEVRWKNRVAAVEQDGQGAALSVETPDGDYRVRADWVIACDGARSPMREFLGLEWKGQVFRDRFLIADVHMRGDYPTERWFWFDPPFHRNQSVLLHRQADDVWRIDFQLGWDADPEEERKPERVIPRIRAMLGDDRPFTLEWVSVYTFQCRRLERFLHGRVIFAGDAAHQVSPFGARGANSGIQDADNLGWKLARVVRGESPAALLETYNTERVAAADENILNSTRSTDFITPKSAVSRVFRDAVLDLAREHPFARRLVNSGRLSAPSTYVPEGLHTADAEAFDGPTRPGAPLTDAPVRRLGREDWLLACTGGCFDALLFASALDAQVAAEVRRLGAALETGARLSVVVPAGTRPEAAGFDGVQVLEDAQGLVASRLGAAPGTLVLLRPDQHLAARWKHWNPGAVRLALRRAQGLAEAVAHAA
ncbi:MAG: FAD-dependent oxidoreductase [Betaproteobacteria bacterium]|jgi:3-(3-hydroxy-phenyl)propionate hydroxylase|nr:FAD-dependent oxidoreductase [Rhodocyclaceae bacterium]MCA3143474.1 FAD-dependent oxidoreductase [Rhodocyclaceae bacterium]MCE2899186.1 FAD-dependent oxidoreductase [Betaproteobacteria bacterium]